MTEISDYFLAGVSVNRDKTDEMTMMLVFKC